MTLKSMLPIVASVVLLMCIRQGSAQTCYFTSDCSWSQLPCNEGYYSTGKTDRTWCWLAMSQWECCLSPTSAPTSQPTAQPTAKPTAQPTNMPTAQPTAQPTVLPTSVPSSKPTMQPSSAPTAQPSKPPTSQPAASPTSLGHIGATGCARVSDSLEMSSSGSVRYTELSSSSCSICNGTFDLVLTDLSVRSGLSKVTVDAMRTVNCGKSLAFATNTLSGAVYQTPLKQAGHLTCLADWTGVFTDQAEYAWGSFSVTLAFADLLGAASGDTVQLSPAYASRSNTIVTAKALTEPLLVINSVSTAPAAGLSNVYETNVQLSLGAQTGGCSFPAAIDIVLGNGGDGCVFENVAARAGAAGQYTWLHAYTVDDVIKCGADVSDAQFITLSMSIGVAYAKHWPSASLPADPQWCFGEQAVLGDRAPQCFGDAALTRPTLAEGQSSAVVRISKSSVSDTTPALDQLALDAVAYGATPGCSDGAEHFSPMGMPWITVRATGRSAGEVAAVVWSALMDGAVTAPVSKSDCDDQNPLTVCATFHSSSCQPMVNFAANKTCIFSNEDKAFSVTATTALGATSATILPGLDFPHATFSTCYTPEATQDVTGQFAMALSTTSTDGSAAISLSSPIVSRLVLQNVSATGTLSLYISDVTVQLRVRGSNQTLAARTFTREEKQRLMQSASSPYFADAHYCRTATSGTCLSFYGANTSPFCNAAPAIYHDATTGGFKGCEPLVGAMNEDRFIFTPSDWGFDGIVSSGAAALELRIQMTAILTPCNTVSSGRRLAAALPQSLKVEATKALVTGKCPASSSAKTCAKDKACAWVSSPLGAARTGAKCYPRSTVAHWACGNILPTSLCTLNPACKVQGTKCAVKAPNKLPTKTPTKPKRGGR
jgi:hypothetical protein